MRNLAASLALLVSLAPSVAMAQSWSDSFASPQTTSIAPAKSVLVAAPDERSTAAATALAEALREAGLALVMTDEALGDISELGDAEIIAKAKNLPVDGIVIIRVFPGKDQSTAVTVFTNLRDDTTVSGTTVEGQAPQVAGIIAANGTETSETLDVLHDKTRALATPRGEITAARATEVADALAVQLNRGKYQREKVVFGDGEWEFYQGAFTTSLTTDAYFRHIGRDDLAQQYESSQSTRTTIFVTSGALAAIAFGMLFVGLLPAADDGEVNPTFTAIGAGAAGLSIGGFIWGAMIDPYPVSSTEAREQGESFNRRLERELGVAEEGAPQAFRLQLLHGRF